LALGLAIAMKVMPVVLLPYLALRRQWRTFFAASVATALLSLSPIVVFGWGRYWEYVASWRRVVGWGWGVGAYNQSIYAMWDRLIGHQVYPFAPGQNYNLVKSGNPAVTVVFGLSLLLIGLLTLRQFRVSAARSALVVAAEWSAMLIISTLWGPVAWKLYFVVLLVPNALLFLVWRRHELDPGGRKAAGWILFSSAALAVLTGHDLIGNQLAGQLELGSIATISVLIMLGGVLWLRGRPDLLQPPIEAAAPSL
ncbi:MAG: glycosyltransferase family 87 protein, partial [Gemmatimonadota bacterium]